MSETLYLGSVKGYSEITATAAISISGTSYVECFKIVNDNRDANLALTFTVGTNSALARFKVSRASKSGGTHKDWLTDTDFNTATALLPFCTANPHTTATNGTFQMILSMNGTPELLFSAGAATTNGTTLNLEGSIVNPHRVP